MTRGIRLGIGFILATLTLAAQTSVRVNVGGPQYTDSNGQVWAADSGCDGSTFASGNIISGTADQTLYQTGRIANNFSCTYTVTGPAFYNVTLRFAETDPTITTKNPRIFNTFVNNTFKQTINIIGSGSPRNTAVDYTFGPIAVYGSTITILLATVSNPSEIQAIDIEAVSPLNGQVRLTGYGTGGPICNANSDGIQLLTSDQLHELAGADCIGEFFVRSEEGGTYKKKAALAARGTGASTNQANGLGLSSDSKIQWGNQDDLIAPNSYDSCLGRLSNGIIFAVPCDSTSTTNAVLGGAAFVFNPGVGQARPTCNSATRGWQWATQGAAGVADTVAVCAKDNTDTYAWRTIY